MIRPLLKVWRRQLLVDIDTQRDFLLANGAACIRNHRRVLVNIRRLTAWARHNRIHIISTAEVHLGKNGNGNGQYCIDGTEGQKKIPYTIRRNRTSFAADGNTDLPRNILRVHDQVIFNKRCADPFKEPRLDRLFSETRADEFILMGVSIEGAVKATALGLLQRGKKVVVVTDATGSRNKKEADLALRQMKAKGAKLVEAKSLAGVSRLRLVGACDCERCRGLMHKEAFQPAVGS